MANNADMAFQRGKTLFQQKDYVAAEQAFLEAIMCNPNQADYHAWLGRAYLANKKNDKVWEQIELAFKLDPNCAMGYFVRGFMFGDKGDWDRAIADYNRVIELNPKFASAYSNRGVVFERKGDLDRAIADYSRVIELDPTGALVYYGRGHVFAKKGDLERAIADYNRAIELDSKYANAYNNRGHAFAEKEDLDRAIADYSRAIELDPKFAWAYNNRGNAFKDKGNLEQAIVDYNRAIEFDPKYANAYNNRGNAFKDKGDLERAIADYNRAIELDPKNANAYYNRGNAFKDKGDLEQAIADKARYFNLESVEGYTDEERQEVLDIIYKYLQQNTLSKLKRDGEKIVDYFPAIFTWGRDTRMIIYRGTSRHAFSGSFGMGYLCLTSHSVHIMSIGNLSRQQLKQSGFWSKAIFSLLNIDDFEKIEKQNRSWVVPYASIDSIQRDNDFIHLVSQNETWRIELIYAHDTRVLTGINMGRQGKLQRIWDQPAQKSSLAETASSAEIVRLLEQLAELKSKGILTETEFEVKKRELLQKL